MDNTSTMDSGALCGTLGQLTPMQAIYRTVQAADCAGIQNTIRTAEELEELESRGIDPYFNKINFRKEVIKQAKANGVWLDASYLSDKELMHDHRILGTAENDIYRNPDGKTLTKLNNLSYVTGRRHDRNFAALIDRLEAHNAVFPEVAYTFMGFTDNKNGFPALVLEQFEVNAKRNATQKEINKHLESIGFALSSIRSWSNHHPVWSNGVYELFDARPANVLMGEDGNLYFVDTVPHSVEYMNAGGD